MHIRVHTLIQELVIPLEEYYQTQSHALNVAWWLLEAATKKSRLQLITTPNFELSAQEHQLLQQWIIQHTQQDFPLQYLIGSVPFGPLEIMVRPPTLIPRPETEQWCASLIQDLQRCTNQPLTILDMCTGSGCIGLWLAHALPKSTVYAVDISDEALALAQENARHHNITNIRFFRSNLFDVFEQQQQFDLIVTNPPYISAQAWTTLSPTVKQWEDRGALVAGLQGLDVIQQIIQEAPHHLVQHGPITHEGIARLIIEIGYDQGALVAELCRNRGFGMIKVLTDNADRDRIVCSW